MKTSWSSASYARWCEQRKRVSPRGVEGTCPWRPWRPLKTSHTSRPAMLPDADDGVGDTWPCRSLLSRIRSITSSSSRLDRAFGRCRARA